MAKHRTQVAIIGGGPSGLLLSQLLYQSGIDSIVLERQSKDYVLGRIRAGVLEAGFVSLMEEAGVADRLHAEGIVHQGIQIADGAEMFRIDFQALTGKPVTVYGQTEVTRDLYAAREAAGGALLFHVSDITMADLDGDKPRLTCLVDGTPTTIDCDYVAGCDGFHGVSRQTIPQTVRREAEKLYPFGWLGILSETPPVNEELIYARSDRGFALCSMRSHSRSRYYIQTPMTDRPEDWTDAAFWAELKRRLPPDVAASLVTGPSIEKSIAPLRSFVCEPMQWGRLFLCGDAAHIVPPTGAKGLNTAASDVHYLHRALQRHYGDQDNSAIATYSANALARVWQAERFSWWFSTLMHKFDTDSDFDQRMQTAELAFLRANPSAQQALAECYVGLPY